jgi:hypothetical protein
VTVSLHSTSPSDYCSIRSSRSPPRGPEESRYQPSPVQREANSPTFHHNDVSKSYSAVETRLIREATQASMLGIKSHLVLAGGLESRDRGETTTGARDRCVSSLRYVYSFSFIITY